MIRYLRILACTLSLAAAGSAWGQESTWRQETVPGQAQQRLTNDSLGEQARPSCPIVPCVGVPTPSFYSFFQIAEILGPCAVGQSCSAGCAKASQSGCSAGQCPATADCGSEDVNTIVTETVAELLQICRILYQQGRYTDVEALARKVLALDPSCSRAQRVLSHACRHTGHSAEPCARDCSEECEAKSSCAKPCCSKCTRSKGDCACDSKCCDDCACGKAKSSTCACKDKCCCDKDGSNCACGESCKCKPATKTSHRRGSSISVIVVCPSQIPAIPHMAVSGPMPFGLPPAVSARMMMPPCPACMPGAAFGFPVPPPPAHAANVLPMPHSVPAMPVSTGCGVMGCIDSYGNVVVKPQQTGSTGCNGAPTSCSRPACVPSPTAVSYDVKPVKVSANGNRVQISTPCMEVQCDRIAIVAENKVLAEGNVSVEFHIPGRPGSIITERAFLGLTDGSYEINPPSAGTNTIRMVKPINGVGSNERNFQVEFIGTPTSCPAGCPFTGSFAPGR